MTIICVKISLDELSFNQGLSIKKIYQVVAVIVNLHGREILYNIQDDFGRLSFYSHNYFDIVDNKIEEDWVINKFTEDEYILLPLVMSFPSFYEDYHNDDPKAIEIFRRRYPPI